MPGCSVWLWRRGQVPGSPLSDGEFEDFRVLLRRYCAYDLDQWDCLRTPTPYGPAYVMFGRALPPGTTDEVFL